MRPVHTGTKERQSPGSRQNTQDSRRDRDSTRKNLNHNPTSPTVNKSMNSLSRTQSCVEIIGDPFRVTMTFSHLLLVYIAQSHLLIKSGSTLPKSYQFSSRVSMELLAFVSSTGEHSPQSTLQPHDQQLGKIRELIQRVAMIQSLHPSVQESQTRCFWSLWTSGHPSSQKTSRKTLLQYLSLFSSVGQLQQFVQNSKMSTHAWELILHHHS